ncbi:MAG: hypothetical protein K2G13_00060, partial [Muribaculaceae bacterium]|nr:hypothetical protein [Muribaculaceae bacterium]
QYAMQVITLDETALDFHASRLAKLVEENASGFFDALVAVHRGGSFVCDAFCRHFPRHRYGNRHDVTLQRASTKRKGNKTGRWLKHLPTPLLDLMRMAESRILSFRHKMKHPSPSPDIEMPEGLKDLLETTSRPKILVIDDAIDSGDTLYAILYTLKKTNRDAEVETAVITETTCHARIGANYSLYHNRTLIRFPWSNDYKKR